MRGQDENIVLNSFIVSNTLYSEIPWNAGGMTKEELEGCNVIFQNDDKDSYISKIVNVSLEDVI